MNPNNISDNEKFIKEQKNKELQSPSPPEEAPRDPLDVPSYSELFSDLLEESLDMKSLEQIKEIFAKTEKMKQVAEAKNEQLEQSFIDLKQRLSTSSQYLLKIKKNIENLKFSYQKNVLDMQQSMDTTEVLDKSLKFETAADMAKHMEEIRKKIDNLQLRTKAQSQKHQSMTMTYQEAFKNVVKALQDIESGAYSSQQLCAKT